MSALAMPLHLVINDQPRLDGPVVRGARRRREVVSIPASAPGALAVRLRGTVARVLFVAGVLAAVVFPLRVATIAEAPSVPALLAPRAPVPAGSHAYVVRPGDTPWAIARRLLPEGDIRPVVARIRAGLHGRSLQPGDRIVIERVLGS